MNNEKIVELLHERFMVASFLAAYENCVNCENYRRTKKYSSMKWECVMEEIGDILEQAGMLEGYAYSMWYAGNRYYHNHPDVKWEYRYIFPTYDELVQYLNSIIAEDPDDHAPYSPESPRRY